MLPSLAKFLRFDAQITTNCIAFLLMISDKTLPHVYIITPSTHPPQTNTQTHTHTPTPVSIYIYIYKYIYIYLYIYIYIYVLYI